MKFPFGAKARASLLLAAVALGVTSLGSTAVAQNTRNDAASRGRAIYQSYTAQPQTSAPASAPLKQVAWENNKIHVIQSPAAPATPPSTISNVSMSSMERIAALEAELTSLKSRLDAHPAQIIDGGGYGVYSGYGGYAPASVGCCAQARHGFYAGYEFVWLKPHFDDQTAFFSTVSGVVGEAHTTVHTFDYDYATTPRVTIGWNSQDDWGFRFRYWSMDHGSNNPTYLIPLTGDAETRDFGAELSTTDAFDSFFLDANGGETISARHNLDLETYDFEMTDQLMFCKGLLTIGGGLRFMNMEQRFQADRYNNGNRVEWIRFAHDFYGIGPTISFDYNRCFFTSGGDCCDSCDPCNPCNVCCKKRSALSFYANGRLSALFGSASSKVNLETVVDDPILERDNYDKQIYIAELGIGLQYDWRNWWVRGGYEGQIWHGAGGPATTDGDMGLHGFTLGLGLDF